MTVSLSSTQALENRAIGLLSQGHGQKSVAGALGVSESLISQWMAREDFALKVSEGLAQVKVSEDNNQRVEKIKSILLEKLEDRASTMYKTSEILAVLKTIGTLRQQPQSITPITQTDITVFTVPPHLMGQAIPAVQYNNKNQAVVVGDKTFLTMPAKLLLKNWTKDDEGAGQTKSQSGAAISISKIESDAAESSNEEFDF